MSLQIEPIQHVLSYLTLRECVEYATTSKAIAAAVRWTIAARGVEWGVGEEEEGEEVLLERVRALWSELPLFALFAPASMQYGDARPRGKEATLLALRALPLGDLVALFSHADYQMSAEEMAHVQKSVLAGSHGGDVEQRHLKRALTTACCEDNRDVINFILDRRPQTRASDLPWCGLIHNIQLIELLFERGVLTVDSVDGSKSTLLHWAVARGSLEATRFLLARRADPHAENRHGKTPLSHALNWRMSPEKQLQSALVAALLEGSADPNRPDIDGRIPLTAYCCYAITELLLRHGARIDQQDPIERQAGLHCLSRRPACIALLLRRGANPHSLDFKGRTPLHHAVIERVKGSIELLFDAGSRLDQKAYDGRDAFDLAQGHPEILALLRRLQGRGRPAAPLLPNQADEAELLQEKSLSPSLVFQIDDLVQVIFSSLRVAEWATLSRLSQVVRRASARLMARRAKEWGVATAHETQREQCSALRALWEELLTVSLFVPAAAQRKTRQMGREALLDDLRALPFAHCARLFLEPDYMCDASPRVPHAEASLFAAPHPEEVEAERLKEEEVEQLLKYAGYYHHLELVHFLITYGALEKGSIRNDIYPALVNDLRITTLLLDQQILTLENKALADESLLSVAIGTHQFAVASCLIERGADPNARNFSRERTLPIRLLVQGGWSSSFTRSSRHSRSLLLTLLKAGADPNLIDNSDNESVLFAVSDLIEFRLLLDYGAEIDRRNRQGETPLYRLARLRGDNWGLIALLLQRGADPNATDRDGRGPLDVATEPETIELLQAAGATAEALWTRRKIAQMTPRSQPKWGGESDQLP